MSAHKHLICCERTVVGLMLPEDDVKKTPKRVGARINMSVKKASVMHGTWK